VLRIWWESNLCHYPDYCCYYCCCVVLKSVRLEVQGEKKHHLHAVCCLHNVTCIPQNACPGRLGLQASSLPLQRGTQIASKDSLVSKTVGTFCLKILILLCPSVLVNFIMIIIQNPTFSGPPLTRIQNLINSSAWPSSYWRASNTAHRPSTTAVCNK
jgi:hypothetical protein